MKSAIIKTGGKQYRVSEGDEVKVEKLDYEEGETVEFDRVLLVDDEDDTEIGKPFVEDATVKGEVLEQGKGEKVIVFKYKSKERYKNKKGHRQPYTKVKIGEIS